MKRMADGRPRALATATVMTALTLLLPGCDSHVVENEPAIPVVDLEGLQQLLADKRGTPLLLNLWAMWCGPCVAELPDLRKVARKRAGDGLEVIALDLELMAPRSNLENTLAQLPGFLHERQIDLPVVVYSGEDVGPLAEWLDESISLPVTVVIGADGEIRARHVGSATEQEFEELADLALAAPGEHR